jgi:mRNA-degrading endonuclease RelE of RelBE toxin-antitoxin system
VTELRYTVSLTRSARHALAEKLPLDVAAGAVEFFAGPLSLDPYRVGKALDAPLDGIYSARLMREWRVLYVVDDEKYLVTVRGVVHRRDAYRSH